MSYAYSHAVVAEQAQADVRAAFIRRTYAHLAGAILVFIGLEAVLVNIPGIEPVVRGMRAMWPLVALLFMGLGWVGAYIAHSGSAPGTQYLGLALVVAGWSLVFLLPLYEATHYLQDKTVIPKAGILTLGVFGGLTAAVLITRKDFSFLGPIICVASFIAFAVIVAGWIFGFSLGLFFCFLMVALASAAILYDTSNVLHHYRTDQHVAAALQLFSSVALLFWYILQIAMAASNNRN
jgi:FtsH-binding integral membrane protein